MKDLDVDVVQTKETFLEEIFAIVENHNAGNHNAGNHNAKNHNATAKNFVGRVALGDC